MTRLFRDKHEERIAFAREAKADRLCRFLRYRGIEHEALSYSAKEWAELAAEAGERPPSEITLAMIRARIEHPSRYDSGWANRDPKLAWMDE